MKSLACLLLLLPSCSHNVLVPQPETYSQFMVRTEGVDCAAVTAHDTGAPVPDCVKLHDAFARGRALVAAKYPEAVNVKMGPVNFWQTQLMWNAGEAFPRMKGNGAMAQTITWASTIQYAFEESVEHEAVHWIMFQIRPDLMRTAEAIAKDADQAGFDRIYQITCHLTSDDPFGIPGTSISVSGRAGCISVAYSGPIPLDHVR